ncbi:TPA: hypothetical protein DD449_02485 [Candidatus Berkelbacteria bacterium]|uniref:Uncharacterized protein n=1 Tax=Berkelbacteria bacterium GW2011_GWE1_39_12 TaxID=1618337 RepID=A0A0G4B1X4_9BACT|nr:MAG: hypothetical protein UT28_C0001G0141 [Berkelbacteria bacterium GW2011_GWE1_39_12]HBO60524.1 hypothetical protein [Candidatus Berkelbacteria bacterium]
MNIFIKSSGPGKASQDTAYKIEKLVEAMPTDMAGCFHTADYASFSAASALYFCFSPSKMQEAGVTEEQIKAYLEKNARVAFSPLHVDCKFEESEESRKMSFREDWDARLAARREDEFDS